MKKLILLLLLPLFCYACSDNESDILNFYEIPTNCNLNIPEGEITWVNNEADFKKLFADYHSMSVPDFRTMNLLLVKGTAPRGIEEISKQFVETDAGGYRLQIDIVLLLTAEVVKWNVAYLVPKAITPDKVELDIHYN